MDTTAPDCMRAAVNMETFPRVIYWAYFFDYPQNHPLSEKNLAVASISFLLFTMHFNSNTVSSLMPYYTLYQHSVKLGFYLHL